jgi:hypothetical protein
MAFTIFASGILKLVPREKRGRDETVRLGCFSLPHCVCRIDCRNCVHVRRILTECIKRDSCLPLSLQCFANIFVGPGKSSLPVSIARIDPRELEKDFLTSMVLGQGGIELLLLEKNPADVAVSCC